MNVTVLNDLVSEPVSLTEAKAWMRIKEFTDDDSLISELVKGTRKHLEKFTGLSFGTKSLRATLTLPDDWMEIPYGPVTAIASVFRWDEGAGEFQAYTDYKSFESRIKVSSKGIYRITYTAGFVPLPEDLQTDIKVLVAWQYQNRGINFGTEAEADGLREYPHWNLLNARQYRKVVI
jgi:uncharacterized phiE125 gp8 family phage protein